MPNYFYYDQNGQKQGPIDDQQLQTLADQGTITPESQLETEGGYKGQAGQIPSLKFAAPASSGPPQQIFEGRGLLALIGGAILLVLIGGWWISSGGPPVGPPDGSQQERYGAGDAYEGRPPAYRVSPGTTEPDARPSRGYQRKRGGYPRRDQVSRVRRTVMGFSS